MKLSKLIKGLGSEVITVSKAVQNNRHSIYPDIDAIYAKACDVKPKGLFVAIKGAKADGHNYIDEALKLGAVVIVCERKIKKNAVVIQVKNSRKALASISAAFWNYPSKKLFIIGITGTNGKTTTTYLIENILNAVGINTGVIGTINFRYSGKIFNTTHTTPESIELQKILFKMKQKGVTHVIIEVSSHAIDLFRIKDCYFDICIFTNLSQDHLDYHKNMESYWECKKELFTRYLSKGSKKDNATAVINCNDIRGKRLYDILSVRKFSVGISSNNIIKPKNISFSLSGICGSIKTPYGCFDFSSSLIGRHNLENILCAAGAAIAVDIPLKAVKKGIENTKIIPGRLERIENNSRSFVFVDYAHTPDALEKVLLVLKDFKKKGRLICIFGCGGDRDPTKRPMMGAVSGRLSDISIITSDNPRTEDPSQIINQIIKGVVHLTKQKYLLNQVADNKINKKGFIIEIDRKKAIEAGIALSLPDDIILIAGKGHENYQIIGDKTISFDDRVEVTKLLQKIGL